MYEELVCKLACEEGIIVCMSVFCKDHAFLYLITCMKLFTLHSSYLSLTLLFTSRRAGSFCVVASLCLLVLLLARLSAVMDYGKGKRDRKRMKKAKSMCIDCTSSLTHLVLM